MPAPREILELVARFEQQFDAYKSGQYNETQVRREFLDPFFKALGWDIDNEQGFAEAYKDVIHEDQIRIAGVIKAPDYCFCIGGTRKYFLEAKKPSVVIKDEPAPAYQLRRYAWSAKLPLSILSDFEEFAVYDGRVKPHKDHTASTARIFYCTFRDYAEKWDWIYERFSRDAVLKGAFDKFAESTKTKRGTTEVDAAFLETIEGWRKELAQNLALRNAKLTQRELNFAVQRIIDRIIFLRICEDRGIEDYGRLRALVNGDRIYPRLTKLFEQADDRYNSGLFHFQKEPGRHEAPDELTLDLDVDDKLLRDWLRGLYYPDSPYEFSVLSADILGQVYEQFLGKVIRLTDGHRAVVDDKPEVKKAGGVYYTPTYIVDYIVRQTVGKLIADISGGPVSIGTTPPHPDPLPPGEGTATVNPGQSKALDSNPARGTILPLPGGEGRGEGERATISPRAATAILNRVAKLRILDPACGSGSFLIGAYQFLLDWHLQFYLANDPAKWAKETRGKHPVIVQGRKGGLQLSIAERKRILLANIHGVDIDSQAVEVTKLSLLLKVLEGESGQAQIYFALKDRVLPDLGDNIKCGNSLIGPDFYQQAELPLLTDEERYRINVFDWQAEFADIFKAGGFDAVIGNPPYIRIQTMQDSQPQEVEFFNHAYKAASQGNYDIYVVFVERGLSLLNKSGKLGFILPNKFFNAQYGQPLREVLSGGKHLEHIVHFGDQQVFSNATTYTCLLFLGNAGNKACDVIKVASLESWRRSGVGECAKLQANIFTAAEWNIELGAKGALRSRLPKLGKPLGEIAHLFVGLQTSADKIYVLSERQGLEQGILKPFLTTGGLHRYSPARRNAWLVFPYSLAKGKAAPLDLNEIRGDFPKAWTYLTENKDTLMARDNGKMRGERWHAYVYPKNLCAMEDHKLIIQVTSKEPTVILDESGLYMTGGGAGPFYGIRPLPAARIELKFLLGILNSKVFGWIVRTQSTPLRGGYFKFSKQYIETTPIPQPDKTQNARMVKLVEQMLELHRQLAVARTPQEQTALERQIAATDTQIDRLVYDLYGLTEDEIKIVEGKTEAQTDAALPPEGGVPAAAVKSKRVRKTKGLYSQPVATPPVAEAEPAAPAFYNAMGKEEAPPYKTEGESP
jgi:hypothetical protein